jgi:hypothetical protein
VDLIADAEALRKTLGLRRGLYPPTPEHARYCPRERVSGAMCGIAGKVTARSAVSPRLVEAMCERQTHRGPGSQGVHAEDGACVGVRRLRVIDLKTGDQPIYSEDRSIVVVLSGEIYNSTARAA